MASTHSQDAANGDKNAGKVIDVERQEQPIQQQPEAPKSLGAGVCHPSPAESNTH